MGPAQGVARSVVVIFQHQADIETFARIIQRLQPREQVVRDFPFAVQRDQQRDDRQGVVAVRH